MLHQSHLFSLRFAHALREVFQEGYSRQQLVKDLLAGTTVGVIAIPLAMALAIASGVAPQYGLYTAIIAGAVIALTGGSRFSVSGPTAAFVVILYPLTAKHGLAGLLIASVMAGGILIAMAYARLGRFIEYIPESVTLGFTGGIAVVIAILQIPDFSGSLPVSGVSEHFVDKILAIFANLSHANLASVVVAGFTLLVMLVWPRLRTPIPPHLPALLLACFLGLLLSEFGFTLDTIGSRFHYLSAEGQTVAGIPPYLPSFDWPWNRPGQGGEVFQLSLSMLSDLLPAAFAIAMLGAIESLLCAVVLDGMSGKRHSANSELLAQGLGNLLAPLFGGITATAAIARSATNFRVGAVSPIAGLTHALVVLFGLVFLSRVLAYIPMPALAALLMVVAWNMSEAHKSVKLVKKSPPGDVFVFVTCFSLTVLFDMVIAVTVGILLASLLFMKEIATLTQTVDVTHDQDFVHKALPPGWKVVKIRGPLFFAAADRIFGELSQKVEGLEGIIIHMKYASYLDAGGLSALEKLMTQCEKKQTRIHFSAWQFQPLKTLAKARMDSISPLDLSYRSLDEAVEASLQIANLQEPRTGVATRKPEQV